MKLIDFLADRLSVRAIHRLEGLCLAALGLALGLAVGYHL